MLISVEARKGAEDALGRGAGLFVDSGLDGEVFHGLHEAGTNLMNGQGTKRRGGGRFD